MADMQVPVYRATVYPFKLLLAPGTTAAISAGLCYIGFIACAAIQVLNSFIIVPLIMIPVMHGVIVAMTWQEPHFDTLLATSLDKNRMNIPLKNLGKKERKAPIFYPS